MRWFLIGVYAVLVFGLFFFIQAMHMQATATVWARANANWELAFSKQDAAGELVAFKHELCAWRQYRAGFWERRSCADIDAVEDIIHMHEIWRLERSR